MTEKPQESNREATVLWQALLTAIKTSLQTNLSLLLGSIAFYTCLPVPQQWPLRFDGIARWAPIVGLGIGGLVALCDAGLDWLGMPLLTRSALSILLWLAITGGLHLDGAMDTADGLAVLDPQRRLQVMVDSHTGAFGAMAAVAILLLKTSALTELESQRWLAFLLAAGWGRWGQLLAIVRYPYLKPAGKGAFHKAAVRSGWDVVPSLIVLLSICGFQSYYSHNGWLLIAGFASGAIAFLTGAWFHYKLGGHTGDTYGAVVEWTEALVLCLLTLFL